MSIDVEPAAESVVDEPGGPGEVEAEQSAAPVKYGGKSGAWDKIWIIYSRRITLEGIPEDTHRYMLGGGLNPRALPSQDGQSLRHHQRPQRLVPRAPPARATSSTSSDGS